MADARLNPLLSPCSHTAGLSPDRPVLPAHLSPRVPVLVDGCNFVTKKKAKCTFVQVLRLCTGCTAHRGSRGIALLFLDHGTGKG